MSSLEGARFGAWFDRLQAMVLYALDRLSRADALTFVPEDLARVLGVDAALVVVGLEPAGQVRAGWYVRADPVTAEAGDAREAAVELARSVDAPRILARYEAATVFGDASGIVSAAAVPMLGRERFGVVVVGTDGVNAFDDQIVALLRVAADQFARVFESARVLGAERAIRERIEFLAGLNELLTRSLDVDEILRFVTRAAVPRLADWCTVLVPATRLGDLDHRAVCHVDPQRTAMARALAESGPARAGARPLDVIATGEERILPRLTADDLAAMSPEVAQIARALDLGAAAMLPLRSPSGVIGALSLMREASREPFDEDEILLAEDVADRLAVGLHNALQYEVQVDIARELQQSLLPRELPGIRGLDLAGAYWAASATADVGGDLYDVFELGDDRWAVLIGDVSGKGIDAASLTALVRHTAREAARHTPQPTDVLRSINDAFAEQEGFRHSEMFCTAVFGVLERDGEGFGFTFALAGHPRPVRVGADGLAHQEGVPGQAIGLFPKIGITESRIVLCPGDVLLLYTDGATDVPGPTGMDTDGWALVVADLVAHAEADTAAAIARLAHDWLARHHASARERDDVALLVLRTAHPS
jgi:serine phosphatase RsbU (regulator of sigma subunit)